MSEDQNMSSPPDVKEYDDWTVIYDDHNGDEHNSKEGERLSDRRQTLARTLSLPKSMCILSGTKTEVSTVAEPVSPRLKLPQLGTETTERVFPVRSVVSFDSTSSSALQTPSLDKLETPTSPFADTWTTGPTNEYPGYQQKNSPGRGATPENDSPRRPDDLTRLHQNTHGSGGFISMSKEHLAAKPNSDTLAQLQAIVQNGADVLGFHQTKRGVEYLHEDEEDILIQSFGALVVMTESDGNLEVQIASNNSKEIIGYSPDELFQLVSFCDVLPSSHQSNFLGHIRFVSSDDYSVESSGPEVFTMSVLSSDGILQDIWCTMHTSKLYENYIICELQSEAASKMHRPEFGSPEDQTTTSEDRALDLTSGAFFEKSNLSAKQPGLGKNSMPDPSELLNTVPRILQQLANAQTLESLVQDTIATLQNLVQFDRTTMYYIDGDRNGIVIVDAVDSSSGLACYEGMRFPESTFPEALKKLYTRNTVCSSFSGRHGTAKLVYRVSTNQRFLNMSNTYLSVSTAVPTPHTDNPVEACLSIQINVFGKLWGLISCQSYNSSQTLHPLIQKVSWFIAEVVSSNIERLSYTLPFQLFQFREPNIFINKTSSSQAIKTPPGDLLSLFGADYAAASIMDETKILGKPTDSQEVLALFEYMRAKENDTVFWSTDIAAEFQDLNYPPGFHHLSGLLYIPLSVDGRDFIIFFRADSDNTNVASDLERPSWQHEWSSADFGKASVLSLLYRTFTDIWREKEATMQNNQLMRLLLANSAHEFRTPLNAIINYLEIVLDGTLDQETRDHISRSHSASKSLVYIINDLLDLTNAENGQRLIKDEVFDLPETLTEATDIFWEEAKQKHVDLQVVQHAALPLVLGDQRRVRQVITNLISNAIQHTSTGAITIETCMVELLEHGRISVEVAIHDTGSGMSQETVETLFCELEQVSNKGYMQTPKSYECIPSGQVLKTESVLGLGLALVARIVHNMNGQLSLKSEEGKGSCFKIWLEFPLPDSSSGPKPDSCTASKETLQEHERKQEIKKHQTSPNCADDREKDMIPCECGQSPVFFPGQSTVNVDVSLKTSDSRKISFPNPQLEGSDQTTSSRRDQDHKQPPETSQPSTIPPNLNPPITTVSTDHPQLDQSKPSSTMEWKLHVLVAEDDPINCAIIQKRLERYGHWVYLTPNGKECVSAYKEYPTGYDVVLMDLQVCTIDDYALIYILIWDRYIQMPIVDGLSAAKMIREFEQLESAKENIIKPHIPLIAVSASLLEEHRQMYMESGFDGWVMKPIDFHRVDRVLAGVRLPWLRHDFVYKPGMWEGGGWFQG
ncbi:hypothetical protein N7475_004858 [Penicillium sp. IBT 31633x]|nr:hypothetical protein N7475_004858 [Penicillium sp. IBT 31633x]